MRNSSIFSLILLGISLHFGSCDQSRSEASTTISNIEQEQVLSNEALIERGAYMVSVMGCNDCHSPKIFGPLGPKPDPERLLSGHPHDMPVPKIDTTLIGPWVLFNPHLTAAIGPWGVSFSANLTSDATGVGNWTEEQFFRAIREGKSKGLANNRNILPPMPWQEHAHLTDEDLRSLLAYLKTVRPVNNVPPPPMSLKEISDK